MKNRNFIINGYKCIKLLFETQQKMWAVYIFSTIIYALCWVLQTISMQYFFDQIYLYDKDKITFNLVIYSLIIMGGVYLFYHFMDGINNCYPEIMELKIRKYIEQKLFRKIKNLNSQEFEDTNKLIQMDKAINGSNKIFWITMSLLDIIFYYIAYFIFISYYLFSLKPILAISVLVIFVPCIISKMIYVKVFRDAEDLSAPLRRENNYYEKCLIDREYLKETRLLGISKYFYDLYINTIRKIHTINLKVNIKTSTINLILNTITVVGYGIILFMLFKFVLTKEISIGAFSAVLLSLVNLYRFMNKLVFERLGFAFENMVYVENFLEFINEKGEINNKIEKDKFEKIRLENVNFKYPNSDKNILNNINLTIEKGENIAIVGANGSGKSTLCKVILGLYKATSGNIYYDENNSNEIYYNDKSAIFQEYCKYEMTLQNNISISDIKNENNEQKALEILKKIKFDYNKIQLKQMIGREFGGSDLSGGQWQKIAIARGLFRNHNLIVLDEPTASIDPIFESELYKSFKEICNDKTAILVTHRLGSTKVMDKVIVLKHGEIVQIGSHNELINIDGEYKKLYTSQDMWYKNDINI